MKALYKVSVVAPLLLLAGCATAVRGNALPPVKTYSAEFQKGLKAELPTVRACCPNTNTFVKDHITLRDQVRAGKQITTKKPGLFKQLFGK